MIFVNRATAPAGSTNGLLTGLESYFKLDEASGTLVDSHGSNDSTSTSNVTYGATGIINDGLSFSGTTSYTSHGDVLDFDSTDPHSFSMWINPDADGTLEIPLSKYDTSGRRGYFVYLDANDKPFYTLRNNDSTNLLTAAATTATIKAADGLVHLVVTYDGSEAASGVTIYVDGSSVSLTTVKDSLSATSINSAPFNISSRNDGSNSFDGVVDEVGVWSRELSSTDVTNLYNSGSGLAYGDFTYSGAGLLTSLESYYKLDEASGTIADSHGSVDSTSESVTYGATGIINDGLDFERSSSNKVLFGTSDYNFERTQAFSVSVWVNKESDGNGMVIYGRAEINSPFEGWFVTIRANNTVRFVLRSNFTTSGIIVDSTNTVLAADGLTHIAVTYDGTSNASGVNIYIDGVAETTSNVQDNLTTSTQVTGVELQISARDGSSEYFDGIIDELGLWSRALTALEVLNLYKGGAGMPYSEFTS